MTAASFQARLWASWTPVLRPSPPVGGKLCAASPARKMRPFRYRAASLARERPRPDQLYLQVRRDLTDCGIDQCPASRFGEFRRRLLRRKVGREQHPLVGQPMGDEHAEHLGVQRPVEDALPVGDQAAEIGGEIDADHVLEHTALVPNIDEPAHRAGRAIAGDQIVAGNCRRAGAGLQRRSSRRPGLADRYTFVTGKKRDQRVPADHLP